MIVTVLLQLLIFWTLSILGYLAARRFHISAPAILGPIAVFVILSIMGIKLKEPGFQKPVLSLITGILLGIRMNHSFKGIRRSVVIYIVWIMGLTFSGMFLLISLGFEKNTAFFSALPGGMAEITLMSLGYDLDHFATVILQTSRMLIPMTVFSAMAAKYHKNHTETIVFEKDRNQKKNIAAEMKHVPLPGWAVIVGGSVFGTYVLRMLGVPLSNVLAPMLITGGILHRGSYQVKINKKLQTAVQMGIGGLTGLILKREEIINFPQYMIPVVALCLLVICAGLFMSKVLRRLTDWDPLTCMLCCCPAGSSPIIMIAMEYGADANIVMIFQILRMIAVLVAAPILIKFIL